MVRRMCLVLATVLALIAYGAPANAHSPFRPGAAGIGDPYFPLAGNGGYDVKHYGLDLRYTPDNDRLAGVAVISARATQNLSAFNLDFHGLTLRSLTVNGRNARWSRSGDELTVTPRSGLRAGRAFEVVARYDGVPGLISDQSLGDGGVFHTDDGMVIVGEPYAASTWFPVNDHPRDKAAYTVRVTVPRGLEAVSNGVLVSHTTKGPWTTWLWNAADPMASYLATATVGEFKTTSYTKGGLQYFDAVDPDLFVAPPARSGNQLAISQTGEPAYKRLTHTIDVPAGGGRMTFWVSREPEIIKFESDIFGRYPFPAVGGIVDDVAGLGFALENQTRPIYAREFFTDPVNADGVIVHELAHQWYGDSLSVENWRDIWLNEGFASYAEWLWSEREGLGTAQEIFDGTYQAIPADDPFWTLRIGDPGPANLFDGAVYTRGAMTLHTLRLQVGDAAFFRILRTWAAAHAGGNVSIAQFVALSERISGQQLDDLFDTWLYTPSKPVLAGAATARVAAAGPTQPTRAPLRK